MKWITREQIRIDRVSSAWLIQKFVDPQAEFLFVPRAEVMVRVGRRERDSLSCAGCRIGAAGGQDRV